MTVGRVDEQLGSYRLVAPIGRGGMGEVWRAEHVQIHSIVAIKLVLGDPADPEVALRFLREAKAAARVRHPGIVAVTDYGERPAGGAYMVMELLDGESLAQRLVHSALELDLAIEIAAQIAEALAAAHDAGVIHRDLKPANVFLVPDPAARGGVRVKLLDFGVAKATSKVTDEHGLTMTGALVGTPLYMAPEQCTSRRGPVDHRADLYALGVVIYEMLLGATPFTGPALGDVIDQHLNDTPGRLRAKLPAVPLWLDELVMLLLSKAREERPEKSAIVAAALRAQSTTKARRSAELATTGVQDVDSPPTPRPRAPSSQPLGSASSDTARDVANVATVDTGPVERVEAVSARRFAELAATASSDELTATEAAKDASGSRGKRPTGDELAATEAAKEAGASGTRRKRVTGDADATALAITASGGYPLKDSRVDGGQRAAALNTQPGTRPRKRRGKWIAAGAIGVIGAAVGIVALATRGGDEDDNLAGLAKLVPVKDDEACEAGIPDACLRSAAKMMAGESPELARVLAKFQTACDRGFTEGCGQVAWMKLDGVGVQPDAAAARELAEKACTAGNGLACNVAGYITRNGIGVPIDHTKAQTRWQRGCDLGYASACMNSARSKLYGLGTARDPAKATSLYAQAASLAERACGPADPESCRVQGLLLYRGSAGTKDIPRGAAMMQKACDLGAPDACGDIGQLYVLGIGLTKDPVRGAAALRRGCERGSIESCNALAVATYNGLLGASPDPTAAHAIAKTTCDNHGDRHCLLIGNFYEIGVGVAKDIKVARAIHERACRAGDSMSCAAAAKPVPGQPQDSAKALELTSRSCDLGWSYGCAQVAKLAAEREDHAIALANYRLACDLSDREIGCPELAAMYFDGVGVAKDEARGQQILIEACDDNAQMACHVLGERLLEGKGMKARPAEALPKLEKACDLGWGKACATLADLLTTKRYGLTADPKRAGALRDKACKMEASLCKR